MSSCLLQTYRPSLIGIECVFVVWVNNKMSSIASIFIAEDILFFTASNEYTPYSVQTWDLSRLVYCKNVHRVSMESKMYSLFGINNKMSSTASIFTENILFFATSNEYRFPFLTIESKRYTIVFNIMVHIGQIR